MKFVTAAKNFVTNIMISVVWHYWFRGSNLQNYLKYYLGKLGITMKYPNIPTIWIFCLNVNKEIEGINELK